MPNQKVDNMPNQKNIFPIRLKEAREKVGMTQTELSEVSGISKTTISSYEALGKIPSLSNTEKLADALNVSIDWLCGREETQKIETYGDIISILIDIYNKVPFDIKFEEKVTIYDKDYYPALDFSRDHIIYEFLRGFKKIKELYENKTIDKELMEAWVEKQIRKYNDLYIGDVWENLKPFEPDEDETVEPDEPF